MKKRTSGTLPRGGTTSDAPAATSTDANTTEPDDLLCSQTDARSCRHSIHIAEMSNLFHSVPPDHHSDLNDLWDAGTPMHSVRLKAQTWISRAATATSEGSSESPLKKSI